MITVTYGDITKNVTVKQAGKPAEGGGEIVTGWIKVKDISDFTEGQYVIVHDVPSKGAYVLPNDQATSAGPTQILLNTKATVSGTTLSTVSDDVKWNLSGTTSAMKIQSAANTANYLYISGSGNSNVRVAAAGSSTTWKITAYNGGFSIQDNTRNRFCGIYTGGSDWRSYTTVNATNYGGNGASLTFYKFVGEEGGNSGGNTPVEPETPATPVLSINPETLSFDAAGGSNTVTCTIENEASGVNVTATETVDWLTTSVNGKTVTITATANTATTTRTANVTIAYTGAESKTVTVNQEAGNAGGGSSTTTTAKVTFSSLYSANTIIDGTTITIDENVSVTFNKGSGGTAPQYYQSGTAVRFYAQNNFVVSSTKTITKITITYGSSDGTNAITASPGTFSSPDWTGSATSVTFTEGGSKGNRRIAAIEVTYLQ